MGGFGSMGDGRVWEQGRWEDVGAAEIGKCGSRRDWRVSEQGDEMVWEQGRWEVIGKGEMVGFGSRGDGRV